MRLLRPFSILPLLLALLASCRSSEPPAASATGSVHLVASSRQALAASDITRVTVTTSAADMPSITIELAQTDGEWGGVIGNIPAGANRTFLAQAYDSTSSLRYEGRAENVTVTAGALTLVTLTLQDVSSSTPFSNEAPIIDSVTASPLVVAPGASVTLVASAHDPNPGDTLAYAWAAASGSFSAPSKPSTNWTAPTTTGPVSLRLTVTDSRGAASSVTLMVRVSAGEGGAVVDVAFNSPPKVVSLTSSESYLDVGQQTTLSASASDADGDSLTYSWRATCSGTFEDAGTSTARFTPALLPTAACNNCQVTVAVSDGRGGQTTASFALCVSKDASQHLPPTIVRSYQSSLTATPGQQLTFEVVASDPESSPLTFSWEANTGYLATPTTGSSISSSRVTWTAPSCASTTPMVTAIVSNAFNLSTTKSYSVMGLAPCSSIWSSTGSMAVSRRWHRAARLPDGRVLVAGGFTPGATLATAELYDPVSGAWSATGAMAKDRWHHTLTLLPDGRVLVAGGNYGGGPERTAEVYDPTLGSWLSTGSMNSRRREHSATVLADGRVLAAGGDALATAELFDPTSGIWHAVESMGSIRAAHTATLLTDGRVLVVGGWRYENSEMIGLNTAEIFDPSSGTWSATVPMASPRYNHTATLLPNGKVLVAGGVPSNGPISLVTAELYDPSSGTWSHVDDMPSRRAAHTATLLPGGKVLLVGGYTGYVPETNNFGIVYDMASGTWSETGRMSAPRYLHTATLLSDGRVLVAGGSSPILATAEVYSP